MSACDNCGTDNIYGSRAERKRPHDLLWICKACRGALRDLVPLPVPVERHPLDYLPLARLAAAALVVISAILAIGAHW